MNKILLNLGRVLYVLLLLILLFVFVGVLLRGVIDIFDTIFLMDYAFAVMYVLLAGILVFAVYRELRFFTSRGALKLLKKRWKFRSFYMISALILLLGIYFFRFQINSGFVFIGIELGNLFLRAADTAYFDLLRINLDSLYFYQLAWLFQLHILYMFMKLVTVIGKKVTDWFY